MINLKYTWFPVHSNMLLQRKTAAVGAGLGKTTGWIHRTGLKNRQVKMFAGVQTLQ
jgi:hypothetical protein